MGVGKINKKNITLILIIFFICANIHTSAAIITQISKSNQVINPFEKTCLINNKYYFVHIADPHIDHDSSKSKNLLKQTVDAILDLDPKPKFVVVTGDLVELGTSKNYLAFRDKIQLQRLKDNDTDLYICPGNHDYYSDILWLPTHLPFDLDQYNNYINEDINKENEEDKFRFVRTYDEPKTCLLFLDSGHDDDILDLIRDKLPEGSGLHSDDIEWINNTLQEYNNYTYKFIFMHHPVVNKDDKGRIAHYRGHFQELCETYNVTAVFSGHIHSWDKQYQVCDKDKNFYSQAVINCNGLSTLYVNTNSVISDGNNKGGWYRIVNVTKDHVEIHEQKSSHDKPNEPPNAPCNPSPDNHATNISINADLSWICTDPNGDALTYDVYFGTSSNPPKVTSTAQSGTTYNLPRMNYNTNYYWKVVVWDKYGASKAGPVWDFTTSNEPPETSVKITRPTPGLYINGNKMAPLRRIMVVGTIDIEATATTTKGEITNIEFYVDGDRKHNDITSPYSWPFSGGKGTHEITVKAYSSVSASEPAEDSIIILVW